MWLELLGVLVFNYIIRTLFIISKNSDDFVHLWNVSQRKALKSIIAQNITNSVVSGKRGYPVLHHYLISLLPQKYWIIAGKSLNMTYDIIVVMTLYFTVNIFFKEHTILNISYGFWVSMIMGTSPILFPVNARLKAMGGRTLGFLFVSLYLFIIAYYFIENDNFLLIFPMSILGILLLLSSQFGFQFYIFYSILISLLYLDFVPLGGLIAIFFIAFVFPRIGLKDIILFKVAHIKWYLKNTQGTIVETRNKIKDIIKLPYNLFFYKAEFFKTVFYKSSYIYGFISLPLFFILLYVGYSHHDTLTSEFLYLSMVAIFGIVILTSHKPLIIMGQAERYLEYATPVVAFYMMYLIDNEVVDERIVIFFFLLNLIGIFLNLLISNVPQIKKNLQVVPNEDYRELIVFLKRLKDAKILTVPIKTSFRLSVDLPNCKYYYRHINQEKTGFDYFSKETLDLNTPKNNSFYFFEKYGIDTFVVEKRYWSKVFDHDSMLSKVFENNEYRVYRVNNA